MRESDQGQTDDAGEIDLPQDWIVAGSDPFDELTVTAPFWQQRKSLDLAENMTLGAILMAHATGRFTGAEAFGALVENDLVNYEDLIWMISIKHRCGKIIDGG